jgi:hypothetical protein
MKKAKKPFKSKLKHNFTPQNQKFSKTFGLQGKISAMHNVQRASGRRGN